MNKAIALYRVRKFLNMLRTGRKAPDDYDWRYYADIYEAGLKEIATEHTLALSPGDYAFEGGHLIRRREILPLHPNYHIVYETLLQLDPASAFEIGCGCGDHLHNIHLMNPGIALYGVDISHGQVAFLKRRHPSLQAQVRQYDITTPPAALDLPQADIAYTQAVIMHIRQNHQNALANLFRIARRQVILMENWKRHAFQEDIRALHRAGRIPWEAVHFHYRESDVSKKPHLMIVSSEPLPAYPVLTDYRLLSDTITQV